MISALVVLSLHFLVTLLYLSPPNLAKQALAVPIRIYMSDLFLQNWKLFSPEPAISSIKVAVRCRDSEGIWTPWGDPIEDLLSELYKNRMTGIGKVIYLYHAIGIGLNGDLVQQRIDCAECTPHEIITRLKNESSYALASRLAQRWCMNSVRRPVAYQFKVVEFFPIQYSQRHESDRRWGRVAEFEFAVIESVSDPTTQPYP